VQKINIAACGTSWHAALAGKFMIERLVRIPVEVDYASEWRYRDPITSSKEITLLITQSGETADNELPRNARPKPKAPRRLAICNVVGAMIAREASERFIPCGTGDWRGLYQGLHRAVDRAVSAALYLGELRGVTSTEDARRYIEELLKLPSKLEAILARDADCEALAKQYYRVQDFLFLGRGIHYPIALEGALKLKEISYIHAEGYPAGEMKHGPNALIDESLPWSCGDERFERSELSAAL